MKTTLDIDDELLIKAKAVSARERKTLAELIEEGLRLRLDGARPKSGRSQRLPVYRGNSGLAKGIDPISNRSLFDAGGDGA